LKEAGVTPRQKSFFMSTACLALALLIGLGVVTFLLSLGLAGLGVLLSWIFPLTPFQGAVLQLVLLSIALIFLGATFLFERLKDTLGAVADEGEEALGGQAAFLEHNDGSAEIRERLPTRRETPKVGRNDPCPCGSGKKYKFCCLMKL
jgi:membrane protein implicated in regulation of membrane protease activity